MDKLFKLLKSTHLWAYNKLCWGVKVGSSAALDFGGNSDRCSCDRTPSTIHEWPYPSSILFPLPVEEIPPSPTFLRYNTPFPYPFWVIPLPLQGADLLPCPVYDTF